MGQTQQLVKALREDPKKYFVILDPAVRLMKLLKTAGWTRALSHLGNHRKGEPETHENAGPLRLRSGQAFDSLRSLRMTTFWRVERLNPQAIAVFRVIRLKLS